MAGAVVDKLLKEKLMILARNISEEQVADTTAALYSAGIRFFEITFNQMQADCDEQGKISIAQAVKVAPSDFIIGAGTVLTVAQVQAAYEGGAKFIVSPGTYPKVIAEAKRLGMAVFPGAMTPTEIVTAWDLGADAVKLFPGDDLGYHYIRNIRGPLPHIPLMVTGGVNPQTIPEFFAAGANAVGTGITVLKPELLKCHDYQGIEQLAREHVLAVANSGK